jgi:energy-coupling factor transporter ATP-binding protein EcfA2
MLRLPSSMSDEDRYSRVEFLLKKLRIKKCENTLIQSLSGGEGRRITLATCLLTNPSVLLIDDLNSGLDSHLVLSLMNHIRSLHKTTLVVLHQPSVRIMNYIDDLCLFGLHGRCLYSGPYEQALPIFYIKCPVDINPADFFLEQAANARSTNPVVKSTECEQILQQQLKEIKRINDNNEEIIYKSKKTYHANFFRQVYWLMWRSVSRRDLKRLAYLLVQSLIIALIYGLLDFNLERILYIQTTVQNVAGLVFRILTIVTRVCSLMVIATCPIDHNLLERESKQLRLYSIAAYYIAKCITDSPMCIIMVFLFTVIVTALTGTHHFFIQYAIYTVATLCSTALGCLVCASMRSNDMRLIMWMPISQVFVSVSGFYVSTRSIPLILKWVQYTSVYYYSFTLSLITQWKDVTYIACVSPHLNRTTISHSNATTNRCNNNGNDVLYFYNVDKNLEVFYWLELIGLLLFFHIAAYIILLIKLRKK